MLSHFELLKHVKLRPVPNTLLNQHIMLSSKADFKDELFRFNYHVKIVDLVEEYSL